MILNYKLISQIKNDKLKMKNREKAVELFKKHWESVNNKECTVDILVNMQYCIDAIEEALGTPKYFLGFDPIESNIDKLQDKTLIEDMIKISKYYEKVPIISEKLDITVQKATDGNYILMEYNQDLPEVFSSLTDLSTTLMFRFLHEHINNKNIFKFKIIYEE